MGNSYIITVYVVLLVKELKHKLLRVSQLCNKGYLITFDTLSFLVAHKYYKKLMFNGSRVNNICMLSLNDVLKRGTKCIVP